MFDEAPIKKTLEDQWKNCTEIVKSLLLKIPEQRKSDFHDNFKVFEIIKKKNERLPAVDKFQILLGVIHKPRGLFFGYFWPLSLPLSGQFTK